MQLTSRAQRIYESAGLAYTWGLIPILLKGKVPVLSKWQDTPYEGSIENFYTNLTGRKPIEQDRMNVGVLTGETDAPSQVVVIDLDKKGVDVWNQLASKHEPVPTLAVQTGSGGFHVYYLYEAKLSSILNFVNTTVGIDYRSTHGQAVWPYSVHPTTGVEYKFYPEDPQMYELNGEWYPIIASMPDWALQFILSIRPGK